jgi:uncharacterized protein YegL
MSSLLVYAALLGAIPSPAADGDTPLPKGPPRLVISASAVRYPEVVLSVHATTRDGAPLTTLQRDDFQVFEDLSRATLSKVEQQRQASARPLDVTFVFDTTGSMQDEIDALVKKSRHFADMLAQTGLDTQLGLVTFGDEVRETVPATDRIEAFKKSLSALHASGGDDEPENQLEALEAALKQPARPGARRVFILVTDATFHAHDKVTPLQADVVQRHLAEQKVSLFVVGPDLDEYHWLPASLGGSFIDKDSGAFEGLVDSLAGELAANYLVTYRTPRPSKDGTRRSVTLTAKTPAGTGEDASQYVAPAMVTASSRQGGLQGDESHSSPHLAIDGRVDTAWVSTGTSQAEWLELEFDEPQHIAHLKVTPSPLERYAVPTVLKVTFDDGSSRTVKLSGGRTPETVDISPAVSARQLRVDIRESAPADLPVAIAEVEVSDDTGLVPELAKLRRTAEQVAQAERVNREGEKAYHAGQLERSAELYLKALDASPEFAQGWSNLGLTYWKLKRYADSVAANRHAIMLARRQGLSQVAASSYYSMGRTFEEQGQLKQALQCMWWANQAVPKEVYRTAVERLTRKLAESAP